MTESFNCCLLLLSRFSRVQLCDPRDGSPPGSPVPGILQARTLEWVAISFSNAWKSKAKVKSLSRVQLLATPWTEAYQAPPSIGFSRQEYWSGVPLPSLCCLLNHHKTKWYERQWSLTSHNNVGWPWVLYYTDSCGFTRMRVSWGRRSKMAWLIGLTVETGCHIWTPWLSSFNHQGLNWLPHYGSLKQSSKKTGKWKWQRLSLTVAQCHFSHLLSVNTN